MTVGEVTPGYELWRPNRDKPETNAVRALMVVLLIASGALVAIITIGGFTLLQGDAVMGIVALFFAAVYWLFAYMCAKWSRGVLPVAAAAAVLMAIYAGVAAPSWFGRDRPGFAESMLPAPLLGLLTVLLIPLQLAVLIVAVIGFNQEWHVEEERPIGPGTDYGAGAPRPGPQAA